MRPDRFRLVACVSDSASTVWVLPPCSPPRPQPQTLPPRSEDDTSRVGPSAIQVFECEFKSSPDEKARRNREFVKANDAILRERAAARARAEEEARWVQHAPVVSPFTRTTSRIPPPPPPLCVTLACAVSWIP